MIIIIEETALPVKNPSSKNKNWKYPSNDLLCKELLRGIASTKLFKIYL